MPPVLVTAPVLAGVVTKVLTLPVGSHVSEVFAPVLPDIAEGRPTWS